MLLFLCAHLKAAAEELPQTEGMQDFYEFARESGAENMVGEIMQDAAAGKMPDFDSIGRWFAARVEDPARQMLRQAVQLCAPVLLLALMGCVLPGRGGADGARFLLNLQLLIVFSNMADGAIEAAGECLLAARRFTNIASPILAAMLATGGMSGASAMIGPAAALAGGIAETALHGWGLPLCRAALCVSVAGSLSSVIDLRRVNRLLRKAASWGCGLLITVFTGLVVIQSGMAETMDGLGLRAAKFAVDSASPVIGSGISDAWDGYISALMLTKNGFGLSGMLVLIAVSLRPLAICLSGMLIMQLCAVLMDVFGEAQACSASEQIAGVCQMALSLCTAALAIATVLLGAAMAVGRNLIV